MVWYHVAEPNSYLVVTGVGIEKVLIKKKVSSTRFNQDNSMLTTSGFRISFPESDQDFYHALRLQHGHPGHDC
jgi:hypothetical protein